ncbi:MAG: T9SS type A sorting domain-containing protein [Bacteroidales bacterium]|jgi:pectate lyase|nr:T9SS type A sorting domain-containing protein [Bacteroidales bacterium]
MKKLLTLCFALLAYSITAQTITKSAGWLESAYICWDTVEGAQAYNVYYSGEGISNQKIDDALIRSYGTYYRADVLGLKAGAYTITVKAVVGDVEQTGATSSSLTVKPHDRSGFAFSNGRIPGGYKLDGTPKDNAVILYVHESNKNTIEATVNGAASNPCVGVQQIIAGFKKGGETRPFIIRFLGTITPTNCLDGQCQGDMLLDFNKSTSEYLTLEGVGDDAVFHSFGLRIKGTHNVEISNLAVMLCASNEGDNIGLQQDNSHIWVHNCDMFYGMPGSDADQAKGDGTMDCKRSNNITFSYNHFWDNGKTHLLGNGATETPGNITYHHNWYDHSDSRHPRVRRHTAHVYNNYFDGVAKYGVGAAETSSIFVEKNVFGYCPKPMLISMQGTDIAGGSGTFSSEDGGMIKAFDNLFLGGFTHKFSAYHATSNPVEFDAVEVANRNDEIASTITAKQGAAGYNNFDTKPTMYAYTPHATSEVVENVKAYAGRMEGGDFKWTFTAADNAKADAADATLLKALNDYRSKLVAIQGQDFTGGNTGGDDDGGGDDSTNPDGIAGGLCDIKAQGTASGITITGNTSTTKGSCTVNGTTYTCCLKMESSTNISFTIEGTQTLTLAFGLANDNAAGRKVKIDGENYTVPANGIVTQDLSEGAHTITKGETMNLFYIALSGNNDDNGDDDGGEETSTQNDLTKSVKIFPNPAKDVLYVDGLDVKQIEIINMIGRIVIKKQTGNTHEQVNISALKEGLYYVRITTKDGQTSTTKLLKK